MWLLSSLGQPDDPTPLHAYFRREVDRELGGIRGSLKLDEHQHLLRTAPALALGAHTQGLRRLRSTGMYIPSENVPPAPRESPTAAAPPSHMPGGRQAAGTRRTRLSGRRQAAVNGC